MFQITPVTNLISNTWADTKILYGKIVLLQEIPVGLMIHTLKQMF